MTAASPSSVITGPLSFGSQGESVKTLQSALNGTGLGGVPLKVDGFFGVKTDAAVRAFQKRNGLQADGIVGAATTKALGLQYVHRPPPPPPHVPPGTPTPQGSTPQMYLMSVVAHELKGVRGKVEGIIADVDPGDDDDVRRRLKLANGSVKMGYMTAGNLLLAAGSSAVGPDFVGGQTTMAVFAMASGVGIAGTHLAAAGVSDFADVLSMQGELNAVSARVGAVVRDGLNGKVKAARDEIRALISPIYN